jgi:hypothetical protein
MSGVPVTSELTRAVQQDRIRRAGAARLSRAARRAGRTG